jgi:hypothetical protein
MTDSPSTDQFPVGSYKEAAPLLRRPFAPGAVKFKIVGGRTVAGYIDARSVIDRLNLVIPDRWHDEYESVGGSGLLCRLTVDGITRVDVGSGYTGKGLYSDAFKRAGVKFGIGIPNYAIPAAQIEEQYIERRKSQKGKDQAFITPDGLKHLRDRYAGWIENYGEDKFGAVLDHGDAEDAVGDVEAEEDGAEPSEQAPPAAEILTDPAALALVERAEALHKNVPLKAMPPAAFRRQLESARSSMSDLEALVTQLEEMQE